MNKKFAIVLALALIAIVCCAGCIDPQEPVDPVDPVVPVDPVDPITPVDPVVPEEPEEPVDPVVPAEGDFTVTFMMNSAVDSGVYLTVYVDEGEAVAEPAVPEKPKAQYIFVQWTTDKENKHAYDFTTPVTADLVLYADWDVKGTSSGSGHSHSYTATVTTEETCGANGVKTYTCSCGASYTEVILATGSHSYGPWVGGKQTCSVCGDVVTCEHPTTALSGTNIVCTVCNTNLGAVAAQVGTDYYATFESAMSEAETGDVIILHAATDGKVIKKVVIDTNDNETSLEYDADALTVADIKIVCSTASDLGTVMFGDEEVVFVVDGSDNYVSGSDGNLIVAYTKKDTTYTVYTDYGLEKALAATDVESNTEVKYVVNLAVDEITSDVTVAQNANVKITIDGNSDGDDAVCNFKGIITIDGKSATYTTAGITIKNIAFSDKTDSVNKDAYIRLGGTNTDRYVCGVTVQNCVFDGTNMVAVKSYTGGDKNLIIDDCTVNANMHSLAQLDNVGGEGVQVIGCTVNSVRGISLGHSKLYMEDCEFDVVKYAVRFGADTCTEVKSSSIIDSTLESDCTDDGVIVFRSCGLYSTLNLDGTTLIGTTVFDYSGSDLRPTIIIDGKRYVTSAEGLAAAVEDGANDLLLAPGNYDVYGCGGKTLTLTGTKDTVLKLYNDGEDGCDYAFGSGGTGVGDITFNGLTIDTTSNTGNYKGYAYMKGTFNDCNFVGAYSLNNANDFTFNRCTFDFKNGYFWIWSAKTATFDGCIFNGNSKTILAHGWESTKITINNCEFAATEKGYASGNVWTAAVEIDPAGTNTYTINFTGENTITDSYAGWTRVKDGSTGHAITGVQT